MGAPYAIVPELLTGKNYGSWKIWMKNYLLGKELWDIVEGTEPKPEEATQVAEFRSWRKKNGKALHAIQVSCGPRLFSSISEMDSAKAAWDKLAFMLQQPVTEKLPELPKSSSLSTQGTHDNTWLLLLHNYVVEGDWERTNSLLNSHPEALSARLSMGETILHTAVIHKHLQLVEELVNLMSTEDLGLTLPYRRGATALHLAAVGGIVSIAEVLVQRDGNLLCLKDQDGFLPVTRASVMGHKDMVRYLYSVTPNGELNLGRIHNGATLLMNMIEAEDYDFALQIHQHSPQWTLAQNVNGVTPLEVLAQRPSAYPSGNRIRFWQRWIYNCINVQQPHAANSESSVQKKVVHSMKELAWDALKILAPGIKQIYNMKLKNIQVLELLERMSDQVSTLNTSQIEGSRVLNAMISASCFGIVEFVVQMVKSNPALLWASAHSTCLFHAVIAERQERIWNLIYGFGAQGVEFATLVDEDKNTWLHVAGLRAPANRLSNISGPAMQMQRELQWYKEVEMMVPPLIRGGLNDKGQTARALFTEQHKDLVKEGERWMKDTSSSCMVVATLIATVMFAAAFTVPGGQNDQTGSPMFLQQKSFMFFIVSDALSLFSSTTSVLMFLSILTSRYAEEDFLKALPKRLIIGLATLFFSIATMMVAFSATLVIVLNDRYKKTAVPVSLLASVPVTLFALLQFPLFVDMVSSTYGSGIFRKQTELLVHSIPALSKRGQYLGP